MVKELDFVKETIELEGKELEQSQEDTNELVVVDILEYLGYDRKRARNLDRLRSGYFTWRLRPKCGEEILLRVEALRSLAEFSELEKLKSETRVFLSNGNYPNVKMSGITDGERVYLVSLENEESSFKASFFSDSDEDVAILKALSPDNDILKELFKVSDEAETSRINSLIEERSFKLFNPSIIDPNGTNKDEVKQRNSDKVYTLLESSLTKDTGETDETEKESPSEPVEIQSIPVESTEEYKALQAKVFSLTEKIKDAAERIAELNNDLASEQEKSKRLQQQIDGSIEPLKLQAIKTLENIKIAPNDSKLYLGVVNSTVVSSRSLKKFIGKVLQRLYNELKLETMPKIFDGDIFNLSENSQDMDLILSSKGYGLDIEGLSEEECVKRLYLVFEAFPTVAFSMKMVYGELLQNQESPNQALSTTSSDEEANGTEGDPTNNATDGSNTPSELLDTPENGSDGIIEFEDREPNDTQETGNSKKCLMLDIFDLSKAYWSDSLDLETPEVITDGKTVLRIDSSSMSSQVAGMIKGAVYFSQDINKAIERLRAVDWRAYSKFVSDGDGIPIPYSKLSIRVEYLGQVFPILTKVCEICGLQPGTLKVGFMGQVKDGEPADIDYEEFDLKSVDNKQPLDGYIETDKKSHNLKICTVSGSILNQVDDSDFVERIENQIITRCLSFKSASIQSAMRDNRDLGLIVTEELANSETPLDDLIERVIDSKKFRFISDEGDDDLGSGIILNGSKYYLYDVAEANKMVELFKLHLIAFGDYNIMIAVEVDYTILEALKNYPGNQADKVADILACTSYLEQRVRQ